MLPIIMGAVVLVAAVTGALMLVRRPGSPHPSDAQKPLVRPVAGGPAGLTMVYTSASVDFADARHGFLLLKLCPTTPPSRPNDVCDAWVAATADGGLTWQPHPVPGTTFTRDDANLVNPVGDIIALDATHVAFVVERSGDDQYHLSADGGLHWTTVPAAPTVDVPTIAVNAYPTVVRGRNGGYDVGVLTAEGTMARLDTPPDEIGGFQRATDGSLWFSGATITRPRFEAYNSRDGGHTWVTVPVPGDRALNDPSAKVLTRDGHTLYAVNATGSVWRSSDAGQHWQKVPLPFGQGGFVATSIRLDGSLAAADIDFKNICVLAPEGATFTPLVPVNGHIALVAHGARYVSAGVSLVDGHIQFGDTLAHSADGVSWIEIPYPPAS